MKRPATVVESDDAERAALRERLEGMVQAIQQATGLPLSALSTTAARTSHGWLSSVKSGKKLLSPEALPLARLCEAYGYNVRWLITGLGPMIVDRADDQRAARERGDARSRPPLSVREELLARVADEPTTMPPLVDVGGAPTAPPRPPKKRS